MNQQGSAEWESVTWPVLILSATLLVENGMVCLAVSEGKEPGAGKAPLKFVDRSFMNPFFLAIGVMVTLFGLWQLDWAFWVHRIDAFRTFFHGFDLGWTYFLMMVSSPIGIIGSVMWPSYWWLITIMIFAVCQILLVKQTKTAPPDWKIFWWKVGSKEIHLSIHSWMVLNSLYVVAGTFLSVLA